MVRFRFAQVRSQRHALLSQDRGTARANGSPASATRRGILSRHACCRWRRFLERSLEVQTLRMVRAPRAGAPSLRMTLAVVKSSSLSTPPDIIRRGATMCRASFSSRSHAPRGS